ncbi:MAG: hypothetical protein RJA99_1853 [Pseudomonadota bacterium]|jgi:hypothetical protein
MTVADAPRARPDPPTRAATPTRRGGTPRGLGLGASDLHGLARIGIDATLAVTDAVEAMHAAIAGLAPPIGGAASTRTRGLTGFVYRRVRGTTRIVGAAIDAAFALVPSSTSAALPAPPHAGREAFVAALNGVFGDRLAATGNPLAIAPSLRADGSGSPAGRRWLVLVHGLCMNELQWRRNGHDHGERLAREAGWTVFRLRYNSGRRVAESGRDLARLLEAELDAAGAPPDEIAILGHSMGGLVARSACAAAVAAGHAWPARLRTLVCLGTPHHGAPLERGGHAIERLLGASPYSAALGRLGGLRSAGIVDLRHGAVDDDDPPGAAPRANGGAARTPARVRIFAVAAVTGSHGRGARAGDGLVPLASALGRHPDPARALGLPAARTAVVSGANHWDLLDHPEVRAHLDRWLA